jgi:hypothetical protein
MHEYDEDDQPLSLPTSSKRGSDIAINYGRLATELVLHPHLGSVNCRIKLSIYIDNAARDLAPALGYLGRSLEFCRPQHAELFGAFDDEASQLVDTLWGSKVNYQAFDLGAIENNSGLWRMLAEQRALTALSLNLISGPFDFPLPTVTFPLAKIALEAYKCEPHGRAAPGRAHPSLRLDLNSPHASTRLVLRALRASSTSALHTPGSNLSVSWMLQRF